MTLRKYLEQRHIELDSGRSCLALEREYWQALEVLAYKDGWNNWRDFFYMRVLHKRREDIPLRVSWDIQLLSICLRSRIRGGND